MTEHVNIQSKFYNFLTGFRGKLIRAITDECGGVIIKFSSVKGKDIKVSMFEKYTGKWHYKLWFSQLSEEIRTNQAIRIKPL